MSYPMMVFISKPDVEIETERPCNFIAEIRSKAFAGNTPDDLPQQPAISACVVTMICPWLPQGCLFGKRKCHGVPVKYGLGR